MSKLHPYQDRKKLKWLGFFLSEHTSALTQEARRRHFIVKPKREMDEQEIDEVITNARLNNQRISIQTNEVVNDKYLPDIKGFINGYDNIGIFVDAEFVEYENIRHVEVYKKKKWSDLD